MIIKLYTSDVDTTNFIKESATYYGILHEIIPVFCEDGNIKSNCIILNDIDGVDYWEGSTIDKILPMLKINYKNISLSISMAYIKDLSIKNK